MRIPFICLIILLSLAACDSNDNDEIQIIENITFKPGQKRTYEQNLILISRDTSGNEVSRTEENAVYVVEARAESESVPEIEGTIQVDMYDPEEPEMVTSNWYTQSDSQLVEVAYRGVGPYIMLKNQSALLRDSFSLFGEIYDEALSGNEITVRVDPRTVLEYPLMEGLNWVSLTSSQFDLVITGEVLEPESIEVPGGTFGCQVVKTTHAFRGISVEMTHYLTAEGLVKRIEKWEGAGRDGQNNPTVTMGIERTVLLVGVENS